MLFYDSINDSMPNRVKTKLSRCNKIAHRSAWDCVMAIIGFFRAYARL